MNTLRRLVCYFSLLLGGAARLVAQGTGDPGPPPPDHGAKLTINTPAAYEQFAQGIPVVIRATAVDPKGAILRVDFFAGSQRLGGSEINPLVPVPPGEPVVHEFVWRDPPVGSHKLFARAQDGSEVGLISPVVVIEVLAPKPGATIHLITPKDLQEFMVGEAVTLTAEAVDPVGLLDSVAFFANGEKIGEAHFDFCPPCDHEPCPGRPCILPPPGTVFTHAFTWPAPPEGKYALEVRGTNSAGIAVGSAPVRIAVTRPAKSALVLQQPTENASFQTPGEVPFVAIAFDPQSEIRRVEFFADDHPIGLSEILTKEAIIPGRPREHHFTWTNPPAGKYTLLARAQDAGRQEVVSAARHVAVQGFDDNLPTISVATEKSPAFEQGDNKSRYGSFRVSRQGGDPSQALTFFFTLGGSAIAGTDYELLDLQGGIPPTDLHSLSIPAGQSSIAIAFLAVPDLAAEGFETVAVILVEPPLASPLPAKYRIGNPGAAKAEIRDGRDGAPPTATLVITAPANDAGFKLGDGITIDTVGQDPASVVDTVEFYANGQKIGERCYTCLVDPVFPPGTPLHNVLEWKPAQAGDYTLTAVGQFGSVGKVKSEPVTIHILDDPQPRLTITQPVNGDVVATDQPTVITAVGIGRVGGITDVELLLDGKQVAVSHIDFIRAPRADEAVEHVFKILIPGGEHLLVARDLTDSRVASDGVKVRLLGTDTSAMLTWVKPPDGAKYAPGEVIGLVVESIEPKALIFRADIFAEGKQIGVAEYNCPVCRPAPGTAILLSFQWAGAPVGQHTLQAIAKDSAGREVVTKRIVVEVTDPPVPRIAAVRSLPAGFRPGAKFTVGLAVKAGEGVQNYVVEEHPPFLFHGGAQPPPEIPRWSVTAISDGGVFDVATGAVKFGPFFDHQARPLSYEITPDEATFEVAEFTGTTVADGIAEKIGGDQVLPGNLRHAADRDPADDSISAVELTAYGAAWKAGHDWPGGPNPIPMNYVTSAGALWRDGESYRFDPAAGPAPLCWVSNPFLPPGAVKPRFHGVALRRVDGANGKSLGVSIRVLPAPDVQVFALEERVTGTPSAISEGGSFDAPSRLIRWGPFMDRQPHTLSYQLEGHDARPPEHGAASFDGTGVSVHPAAATEGTGPRLVSLGATGDGAMQLVVEDDAFTAAAGYELEVSSDLQHWTRTGSFVNGPAAGFARDETPASHGPRFYRAVRVR